MGGKFNGIPVLNSRQTRTFFILFILAIPDYLAEQCAVLGAQWLRHDGRPILQFGAPCLVYHTVGNRMSRSIKGQQEVRELVVGWLAGWRDRHQV